MGFFDGLLGGVMGAEILGSIKTFVEREGGLEALAAQFEKNGLSETFHSWMTDGPNAAITAEQVEQTIGPEKIAEIANLVGLPPEKINALLAEHLPKAVNEMAKDSHASAA